MIVFYYSTDILLLTEQNILYNNEARWLLPLKPKFYFIIHHSVFDINS